ncbi:hypothetical protein EYF80_013192 [Liparis tanakae]|uniref:Uncharacterized protein n=1 Tax=Liparis tanakae TaxID=230148 RepID=A0A4Z2IGT7_9TELE|nr:hypothetical protein EYF80_013192 [Liparis tanakae]
MVVFGEERPESGGCLYSRSIEGSRDKTRCDSYHVLHIVQILGTLGVAVVFSQICCCETVLVPDAQVHPIDHKDLTALERDKRATEKVVEAERGQVSLGSSVVNRNGARVGGGPGVYLAALQQPVSDLMVTEAGCKVENSGTRTVPVLGDGLVEGGGGGGRLVRGACLSGPSAAQVQLSQTPRADLGGGPGSSLVHFKSGSLPIAFSKAESPSTLLFPRINALQDPSV